MIFKKFSCIAAIRLIVLGMLFIFTHPAFSQDLIRLAGIDHVFRDLTNAKSLDLDDFSAFELEAIINPFVEARDVQLAWARETFSRENIGSRSREETETLFAQSVAETNRQAKMAEEMLLPGQKDWLRQAELQLRLARFRDSFCLYAPQINDVIKLSVEQKTGINLILNEVDIEYQKLIADFKTEWHEKASLEFNRILSELTEEQNVMYNQSIGFENQSSWFTPLGFERGRPGAAGGGLIGSSSAK